MGIGKRVAKGPMDSSLLTGAFAQGMHGVPGDTGALAVGHWLQPSDCS